MVVPTGFADAAFTFRSHHALVAYVNGNSRQRSQMYSFTRAVLRVLSRRLLIIKVRIRSLQSPCGMLCGTKVLLGVSLLYSADYESAGVGYASQ
jgi:hypothetical protein